MWQKICSFALAAAIAASAGGCSSGGTASSSAAASGTVSSDTVSSAAVQTKKPEDYKGTITLWTWYDTYFKESMADFKKTYPNVNLKITMVNWGDYLTKFETAKASGSELPDIALGEAAWWGTFLSYDDDTFVDLSTLGFNKDELVDCAKNICVNKKNQLVTIPEGLGVGCVWYRKDLAKKYFGTDDAEKLSAQYTSLDDFISKAGATVKEKSNGSAFAFDNASDLDEALVSSSKKNGANYVSDDGTLKVKESMLKPFTTLQDALKNGYVAKYNGTSLDAAWSAGKVVFFFSAAWRQGLIPGYDKNGKGHWGVMNPPGGTYFRGGTGEFIVNKKDKEKAELCGAFLRHRLFSDSGIAVNNKNGNISAVKSVQEKKLTNGVDSYYGEDLTLKYYNWLASMPSAVTYGKYDNLIETELLSAATDMEKSGTIAEKALDNAVKNMKSKNEDLK